jgi:hypothetical protein
VTEADRQTVEGWLKQQSTDEIHKLLSTRSAAPGSDLDRLARYELARRSRKPKPKPVR